MLVLEDDVTLSTSLWRDRILEAWPHVPQDWDIVYVCYWGHTREGDMVNRYFYRVSFVPRQKHYRGLCGYVFDPTRKVLARVLHKIAETGVISPDVALLNESSLVRSLLFGVVVWLFGMRKSESLTFSLSLEQSKIQRLPNVAIEL